MGGSRFLNVILGASPVMFALLSGTGLQLEAALFAATSLFVYVVAITMLSRKEVGSEKPSLIPFVIIFGLIAAIAAIGLASLHWEFLISLSIFASVIVATFRRHVVADSPSAQKVVRDMVIAIIVFDSVFVSGTAGLPYGLATLLLVAPAVILARKLYVT